MPTRRKADRAPFEVPREVTVRGQKWLVLDDVDIPRKGRDHTYRRLLAEDIDGHCIPETREIHLSGSTMTPRERCSTFLHELLHACLPVGIVTDRQEEDLILAIEEPLLAALSQLDWAPRRSRSSNGR